MTDASYGPSSSFQTQNDVSYRQSKDGAYTSTASIQFLSARTVRYAFTPHFHPYVGELVQRLLAGSVAGLQSADTEAADGPARPGLPTTPPTELFTEESYAPDDRTVLSPWPRKELEFSEGQAYALYNWELFFHVPLATAVHLSSNQRYAQAQRWFHHIFDPTTDAGGKAPERFWGFRPFRDSAVRLIGDELLNLSTHEDEQLCKATLTAIADWEHNPFRPHAVARHRVSAYMFATVFAYLDNLIAWGDSLFREGTRESTNEATQLYILAAGILGPRPQTVQRPGSVRPRTYDSLRKDLDTFGNALRELEADLPFDIAPLPSPTVPGSSGHQNETLRGLGDQALYFGVPRNERLIGYWDTVADRLFKIRNSLDLQGIFRRLPLFAPPIDPALLARATSAGVDVAGVVSGTNQPLPLVRFTFLVQKAMELCQEVKSLGAGLLSAIEKEDSENLAVLRQRHEQAMLGLGEVVRYQQWQEAAKATESTRVTLDSAVNRLRHYEALLGLPSAFSENLEDLDTEGLDRMDFSSAEPGPALNTVHYDKPQDEGRRLSGHEKAELDRLNEAQILHDIAAGLEVAGAVLNLIPTFTIDVKPFGIGSGIQVSGKDLAGLASALARGSSLAAARQSYEGALSAKVAGYDRRVQEWSQQRNAAALEVAQVFKQLRGAQIREHIARTELQNHRKQQEHAKQISEFLSGENAKATSAALYAWTKREVRTLHAEAFQLAFEVASKAERALQHELGDPSAGYLRGGYLGGREGLLAGERLYLDLKRMETAYHDLNRREYELTKHISLRQLDPAALLSLRTTGHCTVSLPEELFDLDCPGHYFRRLRSVSLSLPSVAGRYTNVTCTLTLLKSSVRTTPTAREDGYARQSPDDPRFSDHYGAVESVVTSSGREDAGLFDEGGRDERYLPFEGSGAVGEWQLELPAQIPQFDHAAISDAVLHLRYTAREGGQGLRDDAVGHLEARIAKGEVPGSVRLLSVRHDFPSAWARFRAERPSPEHPAVLTLELEAKHYPFWAKSRLQALLGVELWARTGKQSLTVHAQTDGQESQATLGDQSLPGVYHGSLGAWSAPHPSADRLPSPLGTFSLSFDDNSLEDLWLAITWGKEPKRPEDS